LYTEPVDTARTHLPSPEELKNKILVKAKKIRLTATGSIDTETTVEDLEDTLPPNLSLNQPVAPERRSKKGQLKKQSTILSLEKSEETVKTSLLTQSRALSDCVNYVEACKFTSFDAGRNFWEMSSFEETKALGFCSNQPDQFLTYNKTNLSRIYPKGTRLFSSNLDPLPMWAIGSQMVALNFQESDRFNLYNRAKFQQNGSCGYVLKPAFMEDTETYSFSDSGDRLANIQDRKAVRVSIKLISGQHLPNTSDRQADEIIQPYVKIRVVGHPCDTFEWCSSVVPRNGFNPRWDEVTQFTVKVPELAILEFKVKSKARIVGGASTGIDDHLGSFAIALPMIRKGYRNIGLQNYEGRRLTPANLFVHINLEEMEIVKGHTPSVTS